MTGVGILDATAELLVLVLELVVLVLEDLNGLAVVFLGLHFSHRN